MPGDPNIATVVQNDLADNRQTQTGAGFFFGEVGVENLLGLAFRDTRPLSSTQIHTPGASWLTSASAPKEISTFPCTCSDAWSCPREAPSASGLQRVFHKVRQHPLEQGSVTKDRQGNVGFIYRHHISPLGL